MSCLAMPWYQDATFTLHGCRCSGKALGSHFATDTLLAGCKDSVILTCMCYASQIDVVEDAGEADALADHLDAMFAPDAPPLQWDAAGEYTRARLELYYLAHAAAPLGLDALAEVRFLLGSLVIYQKLMAYRITSRVRGSTLPLWYWDMDCDDDAAIWSCTGSRSNPAPLGLDALSEVRCLPLCLQLMHGMGCVARNLFKTQKCKVKQSFFSKRDCLELYLLAHAAAPLECAQRCSSSR